MKKQNFWKTFVEFWTGDEALQVREQDYLALQKQVLQSKLSLKELKVQKKNATAASERAQCKVERLQRKIAKHPGNDFQALLDEARKSFEKCKRKLDDLYERDTRLQADLTMAEDLMQNEIIRRRALAAISLANSSTELTKALSGDLKTEVMDANLKRMEQSIANLEEQSTKAFHQLLLNYGDGEIEKMDRKALELASAVIANAIQQLTDSIIYLVSAGQQLDFEYIKIQEQLNIWSERKRIAVERNHLPWAHQAHLRAVAMMDFGIEQSIQCEKLASKRAEIDELAQHLQKIAAKIETKIKELSTY